MINILELGKYDEWYASTNKTRWKRDIWKQARESDYDRTRLVNEIELAIDHFAQARKISIDVKNARYH